MYLTLGNIVFEALPIIGLDERYGYDFAEHAVIEGKPLLQCIGDRLDETSLSIRFHFAFCDPDAAFDQLKAAADRHDALRFSSGDGRNYGMRVVTELAKTLVQTADNGRPMVIESQLTLKEWVDADPLGSRQAAQKKNAPGLQGKGPIGKVTPAPRQQAIIAAGQVKANAAQIAKDAGKISALADMLPAGLSGAVNQLKTMAGQIQATVAPAIQQAQNLAAGVQGAAAEVQGKITDISGFASDITRITSGLPYPASLIGDQIASVNRRISTKVTEVITLTSLTQGGAIEAGTRAQMITRMLPVAARS